MMVMRKRKIATNMGDLLQDRYRVRVSATSTATVTGLVFEKGREFS